MSVKIAASVLAADSAALGAEAMAADKAGADWLHVDIMDGHFVPNLSFGPATVKALRSRSRKPLDVHLMVSRPCGFIPTFARAGANCLSWHIESQDKAADVLKALAAHKVKKGVAIRPETPLSRLGGILAKVDFVVVMSVEPGLGGQKFMKRVLPKIFELKSLRKKMDLNYLIEIDGGVDLGTAPLALAAGADVLVAGTAIFAKGNYKKAIEALKHV